MKEFREDLDTEITDHIITAPAAAGASPDSEGIVPTKTRAIRTYLTRRNT